ncbi:type II CAAX prenyl endopeptidase Rce1 family protein [Cryobacterium sp. SO1]|uniref:CPBP family glutamic-type intramembrane protease n=1 Tax=Cryobacterium sp. SO1 TaxID=1897061 RepID=UPI001023E20B|nr:CPBP family glutamic-type intramembrane protease [Cryobacterium sp. SO1]RZI37075.1 hypothetical protein BJQ95_00507 [Cryobacterium sp. SO1]
MSGTRQAQPSRASVLAVGGTAVFLAELPLTSPVPLVLTPVASGLVLWATWTHRWQRLGLSRPPRGAVSGSAWLPVALPLVLVLALVVATTGGLFAACMYLRVGSIWPAILFHAGFDAAQLGSVHQTPPTVDACSTRLTRSLSSA